MTLYAWMSALAAAAGLVLGGLAITRGGKSELSRPLALLAANQFAWNTATVFLTLTGDDNWRWLAAITAPVFPPAAWWFVLVFLGRARELRLATAGIWAVYGLQTVTALVFFFARGLAPANPLGVLSLIHLACDLPLLAVGVALIARHARRTSDRAERSRAWLLIIALVVFVGFVSTDMLHDAGLFHFTFAAAGSFAFNAMLFVLTARLGVYRADDRAAGAAVTLVAVLLMLVGYLAVFLLAEDSRALFAVGLATLSLALVGFGRYALASWAAERAALERLALMGRFAAQMAHDLKNPLAAAKMGVDVLAHELAESQRGTAGKVMDQLDRLGRVIDRYQKLAKLEPSLEELEANAFLARTLGLQGLAAPQGVTLVTEPSPAPLTFQADPDLLASAVENLVKNAFEATASGKVTVRVRPRPHDTAPGVELEVEDTGSGMDARARERAFDLFFTTKAQGSGLGLQFVRQVARAHGGDATLWSQEGRGTRVTLWIPRASP